MEARKWEELPMDCLVNILGRVGLIEPLVLDIPFVCKSWHKASLIPLCWKHLDFALIYGANEYEAFLSRFKICYGVEDICGIKLVKGVINRSAGCASYVELPALYGEELSYVADHNCPDLKTLVLHSTVLCTMLDRPCVIGKFKNLEMLCFWRCARLDFLLFVIHIHNCQNFTALNLVSERCVPFSIWEAEVMTIVEYFLKLKALTLQWVWIERKFLINLINGCANLVNLDVSDCFGFDGKNEQLLKLASLIPTFKSSSSVYEYSNGVDDYFCNSEFDFNLMIS